MSGSPPSPSALRVANLSPKAPKPFVIVPDPSALQDLAQDLGVDALRKLRFEGALAAQGKKDWALTGTLGATVVQPCAVTLAPVTTRIETSVERLFVHDLEEPDAPETEMPEDDRVEALGAWIDPEAIMIEALTLEIPQYPRADGAVLGETVVTELGKAALRDVDLKPFSGLAALKTQIKARDSG